MSIEADRDPLEQSREHLHRSRAEILALVARLRGDAPEPEAFPRSHIMRAATSPSARVVLSGAALTLALLRPGLLTVVGRLAPLAPLLRRAVNRYVVRRIFR